MAAVVPTWWQCSACGCIACIKSGRNLYGAECRNCKAADKMELLLSPQIRLQGIRNKPFYKNARKSKE